VHATNCLRCFAVLLGSGVCLSRAVFLCLSLLSLWDIFFLQHSTCGECVDALVLKCVVLAAAVLCLSPLQVTARLLLDLREQLHPVQHPVKVSGKLSGRYNVAGSTAGHMWKVTLWSLVESPACEWVPGVHSVFFCLYVVFRGVRLGLFG
jgi:hypothetical protein